MIESTMNTGDRGILVIQDSTDGPGKTVDLYVQSLSPVFIAAMPWTYSIDGVMQPWQSYRLKFNAARQHLGVVYVGYADSFTLHLGDTGKPELGGPTDFTIALNQLGIKSVSIKVGDIWKQAIPYVNVDGVWTPAKAYVMSAGTWQEAT